MCICASVFTCCEVVCVRESVWMDCLLGEAAFVCLPYQL